MPPSKWITHVKQYAAEHNIPYKEALSKASPSYKKGSGETHMMPDGTVMKGKTHKGKGWDSNSYTPAGNGCCD